MSELTEDSRSQYDETESQATTNATENTENPVVEEEPASEPQESEEPSQAPEEDEQQEIKEEETERSAEGDGNAEKVTVGTEDKPLETDGEGTITTVDTLVDGTESEDVDFTNKITQEIDEADEVQGGEPDATKAAEDEKQEGDQEVPDEEEKKKEKMTEGERMLAEIDTSKVIEETDTEIDYQRQLEDVEDLSHINLQAEDLPEIRGLAALEYESPDDSQKEVTFDDIYLTKRKSVRPSVAVKLLAEEEAAEKRRKLRKEMAKGKKIVEEEEIIVEEVLHTREELYAIHEQLTADISYIRMKNKFLQRKMADFFKKRKMEHVLKEEAEIHADHIQKYEKKLDRLADLLQVYNAETAKIGKEIELLENERDEKYAERNSLCQKGVSREREIGIGLISTKTGKEIPDKVVEQLIRRQINAARQISDLRLRYIAKRDELAEKTAELKALDNIGDDLSLMDYEQLKIENRAHSDKLEEKEEELTKLRIKCRNAVQIMAHVREKSAALDADMDVLKEEFEEVHYQYIEIRERLNFYKTERDVIRNKTMKLKEESGLLTKPKLLQDMETSMQEATLYEKTLEKVKQEYNEKTQQIRNLRKNIAYEMVMSKKQHRERKKKMPPAKFFKVRPTLIVPKLPESFLDKLASTSKKKEGNDE
ncbi:coiled-coil domain-containing protein 96-like isoform X2 [Coccinella septempunctata]|uniref:coiled-coil domain-containing protein 96-like isoform X2 n=1 Tax=Coccinella septempunctata TaxID=41139 RepID=UPI001D0706AB|nr:coiled-coil domain-containing protein 96-like isoform X2 [Coccinella septempunctata]